MTPSVFRMCWVVSKRVYEKVNDLLGTVMSFDKIVMGLEVSRWGSYKDMLVDIYDEGWHILYM